MPWVPEVLVQDAEIRIETDLCATVYPTTGFNDTRMSTFVWVVRLLIIYIVFDAISIFTSDTLSISLDPSHWIQRRRQRLPSLIFALSTQTRRQIQLAPTSLPSTTVSPSMIYPSLGRYPSRSGTSRRSTQNRTIISMPRTSSAIALSILATSTKLSWKRRYNNCTRNGEKTSIRQSSKQSKQFSLAPPLVYLSTPSTIALFGPSAPQPVSTHLPCFS